MKKLKVEDAIGETLFYDVTRIEKGVFKGVLFSKGHIIQKDDVDKFLDVGKRHIYVEEEVDEQLIHEIDAAKLIYEYCKSDNMQPTDVREGKVEAIAECDGILKVDIELLNTINEIDDVIVSCKKSHTLIKKGEKIFAGKIIPIAIEKEKLDNFVKFLRGKKLFEFIPLRHKKIGLVITGSEIYTGRIKDKFEPTIREKLSNFDVEIIGKFTCNDEVEMIEDAIKNHLDNGADIVLCSGGMSVDPDDLTPTAIRSVGADIINHGSPVIPGAMFLVSYLGDKVILGLPGSVIFVETTVFDVCLPNILADYKIDKKFIAKLGHGGLSVETLIK